MKTWGRGSLKSWVTVGAWGALCWVVAYKQPTYNIQQYLQHTTYNTAVHCGSLTSPSVGSPPINSQATVGPWALCGTTSCTPSWWICATCNTIFKSRVQLHRYIASWLDGTQVKIKLGCKLHSASTWTIPRTNQSWMLSLSFLFVWEVSLWCQLLCICVIGRPGGGRWDPEGWRRQGPRSHGSGSLLWLLPHQRNRGGFRTIWLFPSFRHQGHSSAVAANQAFVVNKIRNNCLSFWNQS